MSTPQAPVKNSLRTFNQDIVNNPRTQEYLAQVLGEKKSSFVNNLTALVANNKTLQECVPTTLMYAALKATALDLPLDPNLGFAYVIAYKNNKEGITEAQFQIGTKGFKQLAIRTGQFKHIHATDVREGEIASRNFLTGEIAFSWIQDEAEREKAKVVGYVSYFELTNGYSSTMYMTVKDLEAHGLRYSQSFKSTNKWTKDNSLWSTDFSSMAKKTVLKLNLSKNAPLSIEMQDAINYDQSVIYKDSQKYIDNQKELDEEKQSKVNKMFGGSAEDVDSEDVDSEDVPCDTETGELIDNKESETDK